MSIIRELNKDTAYHRLTADLKASIEQEEFKNHVNTMGRLLSGILDGIESEFDSDETFKHPDYALEYLKAARYMKKYCGRKDNGMIDRIQEWYDKI